MTNAKARNERIEKWMLKTLNAGCMDYWRLTCGDQERHNEVLARLIREGKIERELNMCLITDKGRALVR